MHAHDYYKHHGHPHDPHPELHNKHEGAPYIDPDFFANYHDAQLPIISTIGRGPKGEGVEARYVNSEDPAKGFKIVGSESGKVEYESPDFSVYSKGDKGDPGEAGPNNVRYANYTHVGAVGGSGVTAGGYVLIENFAADGVVVSCRLGNALQSYSYSFSNTIGHNVQVNISFTSASAIPPRSLKFDIIAYGTPA